MEPWPLDLTELPQQLGRRGVRLGVPAHFRRQTASTNDDAKAAARTGAAHGSLWLADSQSQGRGRQGRSWHNEPGASVLLSLLWRENLRSAHIAQVALAVGLSARAAIAAALPQRQVLLKWPNDVLVRGEDGALRKLCGVLVEAQSRGAQVESLVIGVGINVHTRAFQEEFSARASSVALEGGVAERSELIASLLQRLERDVPEVLSRGLGALHDELSRHDALRGQPVRSELGAGIAEGIDLHGGLRVRDALGEVRSWSSGEVHLAAPQHGDTA